LIRQDRLESEGTASGSVTGKRVTQRRSHMTASELEPALVRPWAAQVTAD
jgi:hypothetical protein